MTYKSFVIMLFLCVFSSCQQNDLGITYDPEKKIEKPAPDPDPPKDDKIEGEWVGKLICPQCCEREYDFDLEITDYDKDEFSFNTKLTIRALKNGKPTNIYAIYDCSGSYKNKVMRIDGRNIIEKNERSCSFCKENKYELKRVSETKFEGKWTYSYCSSSTIKTATIIIEKKNKKS